MVSCLSCFTKVGNYHSASSARMGVCSLFTKGYLFMRVDALLGIGFCFLLFFMLCYAMLSMEKPEWDRFVCACVCQLAPHA